MSVLEMKVPSPGESISEVEIAQWLVSDGDYVEKDQAIAEVDSDKATLELPAEESGIITLKAEDGDTVAVGAVVCLIDTSAEKPADFVSADTAPVVAAVEAAPAILTVVAAVLKRLTVVAVADPAMLTMFDDSSLMVTAEFWIIFPVVRSNLATALSVDENGNSNFAKLLLNL